MFDSGSFNCGILYYGYNLNLYQEELFFDEHNKERKIDRKIFKNKRKI